MNIQIDTFVLTLGLYIIMLKCDLKKKKKKSSQYISVDLFIYLFIYF